MEKISILFMGRKKQAADMIRWLFDSGFDVKAVVTDSHIYGSPTAIEAETLKIPIISYEESEALVVDNQIDLVLSFLYWKRIREPLISAPRLGCINFHPAILPDYKGCGGYNLAILEQLNEWGASSHYVDETIDTGKIIDVFKFSIDHRLETAESLERKTLQLQCDLFKSIMTEIKYQGKITRATKNNVGGIYLSKKQMLDLMKIDLSTDNAETIERKIRACWFPPYNGAYIEIDGEKFTLVSDFILKQLTKTDQSILNA